MKKKCELSARDTVVISKEDVIGLFSTCNRAIYKM